MKSAFLEKIFYFLGFGSPGKKFELEKIKPEQIKGIKLKGLFDLGFSLEQYSFPLEKEHKRTYLGELVYQLKYRYDEEAGLVLVELVSKFIKENEELKSVDFILPVPPSFRSRPFHPVSFLGNEISIRLSILFEKDLLMRTRLSRPQKELRSLQSKRENVKGLFKIVDPEKIQGKKILIIDDLFDSGATLNEIT